MTWALGLLGLLNPFKWLGGLFTSFGASIASVLAIVAAFSQGLVPLLTALSNALVWLLKEFMNGVQVCLSNLSTLLVISVAVATTGIYLHHNDAVACREQIELQKRVDAARAKAGTPIVTKPPKSKDKR